MSWILFKANVLKAMVTRRFLGNSDGFSTFYANEYDRCIKRGGDMIYGVPVINGNVQGMANVIKAAFKKGVNSDGENFNLLQEIYPAAFDAYWLGAEMAPLPNPLLRPLGWQSTPPAPGTILNIGPNPISLAKSIVINKALKEAAQLLVDALKKQTIDIDGIIINVYDTIIKILKKERIADEIKNHPAIIAGKAVVEKYNQIKNKKPSIGSQFKPSIKFPFPELPKRKDLIKKATNKLLDEAIEEIKKGLISAIEEKILQPIIAPIQTVIELSKTIPSPKPTKEQIKKSVIDAINGLKPEIDLSAFTIPKLPTKEELKKQIEDGLPTKEELMDMAFDAIKGLIPNIPTVWFVPPTILLTAPTNILLDPFVNLAKIHLLGVGGVMTVLAQYPPPAPPAPAIINWSGYKIIG
jgi:transcriptional regulator of met regulon